MSHRSVRCVLGCVVAVAAALGGVGCGSGDDQADPATAEEDQGGTETSTTTDPPTTTESSTTTEATTTTSTTAVDDPRATADISGQWTFTLTESRCSLADCGEPIPSLTVSIACPGPQCAVTIDDPPYMRLTPGLNGATTLDGPSTGASRGFTSFATVSAFWECEGVPVDATANLNLDVVEAAGGQATDLAGSLILRSEIGSDCRGGSVSGIPGTDSLTAEVVYDLTGSR